MLQMTCGTKENFCVITTSPWIQHRTRGLLGTPDHDQSNDFLTAREQVNLYFYLFNKYMNNIRPCGRMVSASDC